MDGEVTDLDVELGTQEFVDGSEAPCLLIYVDGERYVLDLADALQLSLLEQHNGDGYDATMRTVGAFLEANAAEGVEA